jgi:hypothetical protein
VLALSLAVDVGSVLAIFLGFGSPLHLPPPLHLGFWKWVIQIGLGTLALSSYRGGGDTLEHPTGLARRAVAALMLGHLWTLASTVTRDSQSSTLPPPVLVGAAISLAFVLVSLAWLATREATADRDQPR